MDRRGVLVGLGGLAKGIPLGIFGVAAPGWPHGVAKASEAAKPAKTSLESKFAEFALDIRFEALPPEVITAAKRVILDTFGCALGAVGSEPATIAEATIRQTFGRGSTSTILGYPRRATSEGAIFVNGVLVRALDLNDTYIGTDPLHPSELLPTALALCEELGTDGKTLIEALAAGYEASMRVNDAISFMERGFHPLCAASYGVPLIAGKVWGLSKDKIAHAVGLSGARGFTSFVVNSGAISMMKAMGLSANAVDGVFATRLAAQGFTGPTGTLEWMAARIKPEKANLAVDLEPARYRLPRVAFKRFPIQIELQAVAEAGALLSPRIKSSLGSVSAITVETYPGIIERVADDDKFRPQTKATADHSLPVALAMALLDGDVTITQFEKDRWRASDVMALVSKTLVKPSETLIAKRPKGRGASVEVRFADGRSFRETVEIAEGDAERPLSRDSLVHKFTNLAAPVVGTDRAQHIVKLVDSLDDLRSIRSLTAALKGSGRQRAN